MGNRRVPGLWTIASLILLTGLGAEFGRVIRISQIRNAEGNVSGVIYLEDYFEEGERRVESALDRVENAGMRAVSEVAEPAIVRVWVSLSSDDPSVWRMEKGSGVLFRDRRHILTAAHLLISTRGNEGLVIYIGFADGTVIPAKPLGGWEKVLEDSAHDWAILRLDRDAPAAAMELVDELGPAKVSTMLMGYAATIGRLPGSTETATDNPLARLELSALRVLGELHFYDDRLEGEFVPKDGAMPMSGMSGGAFIDRKGRVVAIEKGSITRSADGRAFEQVLRAIPVKSMLEEMRLIFDREVESRDASLSVQSLQR